MSVNACAPVRAAFSAWSDTRILAATIRPPSTARPAQAMKVITSPTTSAEIEPRSVTRSRHSAEQSIPASLVNHVSRRSVDVDDFQRPGRHRATPQTQQRQSCVIDRACHRHRDEPQSTLRFLPDLNPDVSTTGTREGQIGHRRTRTHRGVSRTRDSRCSTCCMVRGMLNLPKRLSGAPADDDEQRENHQDRRKQHQLDDCTAVIDPSGSHDSLPCSETNSSRDSRALRVTVVGKNGATRGMRTTIVATTSRPETSRRGGTAAIAPKSASARAAARSPTPCTAPLREAAEAASDATDEATFAAWRKTVTWMAIQKMPITTGTASTVCATASPLSSTRRRTVISPGSASWLCSALST